MAPPPTLVPSQSHQPSRPPPPSDAFVPTRLRRTKVSYVLVTCTEVLMSMQLTSPTGRVFPVRLAETPRDGSPLIWRKLKGPRKPAES